ncbi:hypothetical protein SARC_10242 [Sphaeroforma arctica JP610]|uniref:Uncharacterized protein n=1 Tax=Sphaeroforma arctica JP610 TaxID=667725 RepID=A0A0L0FMN9_9EUKA|nr:hypothetical protein SARC_10242 [Sphaeroforma arctica JP610]KNC77298.1 hypothetical protein SARC_10242 [Sphaeroforma arctica JP610]|eukprot:XP_014151200.1 hypothetical protein SARC_10242 [Sphaeroforma arctica JP610]
MSPDILMHINTDADRRNLTKSTFRIQRQYKHEHTPNTTMPQDISNKDCFKGRWVLDKSNSEGVEPLLKDGGVDYLKRKTLCTLTTDLELQVACERENKVTITEVQYTSFVNMINNMELGMELGMDNEFLGWTDYHDDTFSVYCRKHPKWDAATGRLWMHAVSVKKHEGDYDWTEERLVENGLLHWLTTQNYKGKMTTNHRIFVHKA